MTTYEITPDPTISVLGNVISYQATSVDAIYATLRDIATVARETGPITLCGSYATAGNRLIARVKATEPWWSVATDSWVGYDETGNVTPINR